MLHLSQYKEEYYIIQKELTEQLTPYLVTQNELKAEFNENNDRELYQRFTQK